jgi:hypothetical protein
LRAARRHPLMCGDQATSAAHMSTTGNGHDRSGTHRRGVLHPAAGVSARRQPAHRRHRSRDAAAVLVFVRNRTGTPPSRLDAGDSGHPHRECPVESCGPQPGRHACADGWPGVTATSRVGPAGSRSVIGANVVVIHCVSSHLDSGWLEHSATWVTNRGEPMSLTVGSRAPSVQLMIFTAD